MRPKEIIIVATATATAVIAACEAMSEAKTDELQPHLGAASCGLRDVVRQEIETIAVGT